MKKENSGYDGLWTSTPATFNNEYYILMLNKGWGPERNIHQNKNKNAWKIIDKSGTDPSNKFYEQHKGIMYLNTDMCLAYNNNFDTMAAKVLYQKFKKDFTLADNTQLWTGAMRKQLVMRGSLLNAKNRNCCAWFSEKDLLKNENKHKGGKKKWKNNLHLDYCGLEIDRKMKKGKANQAMIRKQCCGGLEDWDPKNRWAETQPQNCEYHGDVRGPGIDFVLEYANDEEAWLKDYLDAWKVATENVMVYTQNQWKGKKYFKKNYEKYIGGEEGKKLIECKGIDWCTKKKQRRKRIPKVPGYRPFQYDYKSKSIQSDNEGWNEHICLMEENTYEPVFWKNRAEGHGHSCYGTQFTELRAPYDNVAVTKRRIPNYSKADPDWQNHDPKIPTAEEAA